MARKRPVRVGKIRRVAKGGAAAVTRAEFDGLVKLLNERGEIINALRRELHEACRDLGEDLRRELRTQFTRIAQLQQEIDALKRRSS